MTVFEDLCCEESTLECGFPLITISFFLRRFLEKEKEKGRKKINFLFQSQFNIYKCIFKKNNDKKKKKDKSVFFGYNFIFSWTFKAVIYIYVFLNSK